MKTLETRNHTMFVPYEGQEVLLHVGRRTYPDGGIHREILARDGRDDSEIKIIQLTGKIPVRVIAEDESVLMDKLSIQHPQTKFYYKVRSFSFFAFSLFRTDGNVHFSTTGGCADGYSTRITF